ncbi:hypothetical protein H6P81_004639 [Aristolochia fimbriata]|uniref:Protein NRT1/ PTR FAMILY 4.6 n=1 Tax=Aristolochia fimbriata TaxID=158543 RepID=A0AAV7EUI2_ARIFI|nr:hypothetical protein H6P81_004639 [Aristolochia fimbriata]
MEEGVGAETWAGYVDWKGRPALRSRHGGMLAASFVLGVEVLENLAFLANASNLVTYMSKFMHFSPSRSATTVTNFMGTAFLLALLGGFFSDAFLTSYHMYLISASVEFLGLVILTAQAHLPSLKPPPCSSSAADFALPCQEAGGGKAGMLFLGLYLVALGVGGIKGSLPAHGAEQFDEENPRGRKQRSTFFSYFVFCLSSGALIAVTLVVWVEDNKGWEWGFGISTAAILFSIPLFLSGSPTYRNKIPNGSPLTTMAKVLIGSIWNSSISRRSPRNAVVSLATSPVNPSRAVTGGKEETQKSPEKEGIELQTDSLRFLNRALETVPSCSRLHCTVQEVEEVKVVMKIIPIFACTIMLNCCLAQLSTFSVQQAATMDTKLGSLTVPPASLPIFPVVFIMILAPVYDHIIVPFARKQTKTEMGITHLQRIGTGLVLSIVAMAVAALVEIKRKRVATHSGLLDSTRSLPVTFFWIALQYLFLGSADLFTLAGLMEFFFTEAPASMRSLATSLSFASLAMGYYLSSVLVSVVNRATGDRPWLSGSNLNSYHLERFYWLMCVLSTLNFLHYLLWASRYKYSYIDRLAWNPGVKQSTPCTCVRLNGHVLNKSSRSYTRVIESKCTLPSVTNPATLHPCRTDMKVTSFGKTPSSLMRENSSKHFSLAPFIAKPAMMLLQVKTFLFPIFQNTSNALETAPHLEYMSMSAVPSVTLMCLSRLPTLCIARNHCIPGNKVSMRHFIKKLPCIANVPRTRTRTDHCRLDNQIRTVNALKDFTGRIRCLKFCIHILEGSTSEKKKQRIVVGCDEFAIAFYGGGQFALVSLSLSQPPPFEASVKGKRLIINLLRKEGSAGNTYDSGPLPSPQRTRKKEQLSFCSLLFLHRSGKKNWIMINKLLSKTIAVIPQTSTSRRHNKSAQ